MLAVGACGPKLAPAPPVHPLSGHVRTLDATCELVPDGVRCRATNPSDEDYGIAHVMVFVGARRTGALHDVQVVGRVLLPHEHDEIDVPMDVPPRQLCGADLAGCRLLVTPAVEVPVRRVFAFAHELESNATERGDRPLLGECDAVRRAWLASDGFPSYRAYLDVADAVDLLCLEMSREMFECARGARAEADLERCHAR